jgi:hypothetical protein
MTHRAFTLVGEGDNMVRSMAAVLIPLSVMRANAEVPITSHTAATRVFFSVGGTYIGSTTQIMCRHLYVDALVRYRAQAYSCSSVA